MQRMMGFGILVVGIIILIFGINSANKVGEQVVEAVSGKYTEGTMGYIIGGIALIVVGGAIALIRRRP